MRVVDVRIVLFTDYCATVQVKCTPRCVSTTNSIMGNWGLHELLAFQLSGFEKQLREIFVAGNFYKID